MPQPMAQPDREVAAAVAYRVAVSGALTIHDGRGQRVRLTARKPLAIVGYLCSAPGMSGSREELAELLWSDRGREQARASLRQALRELRAAFLGGGEEPLAIDRHVVALDPNLVSTDLDLLGRLETMRPAEVAAHAGTWRGELMAGLDGLDRRFDDWLRIERSAWERRTLAALDRALAAAEAERDDATAKAIAEELLRIDSGWEAAHRALMRADAGAGNRATALRRYDRLCRYLAEDHRTHPAQATQELARTIRDGMPGATATVTSAGPAVPAPAAPGFAEAPPDLAALVPPLAEAGRERHPSVVVLPFRTLGDDDAIAYVGEGLADDLTLALSRMREFRVLSPHTGAALAAVGVDFDALVTENRIDYAIQGSIRRDGEGLRVNVHILNLRTNRQLWGERLDCPGAVTGGFFDDLLFRVLGVLTPTVERDYMNLPATGSDARARAYDLYLRGKYLIHHGLDLATGQTCKGLLEQAIETDPALSIAYGHLVRLYNTDLLESRAGGDLGRQRARAMELARRALELDTGDPHAYISMAWCHMWRREFDEAEHHFDRARALRPYDADRLTDIATGMALLGRAEEAVELMERAMAINPLYPEGYRADLAEIRFLLGEYETALSLYHMLTFENPRRLLWQCACLGLTGRETEGAATGARFVDLVRSVWIGDPDAGPAEFVAWSMSHLPFRRPEDEACLRQGLRAAGLPA